jgi:integrase/recombinase XerD
MKATLQNYLEKRYAAQSADSYRRGIELYTSNFKNAEKANYQQIIENIGHLRNRYKNPKTLTRLLAHIKAYYDFLYQTGKRKDNPAKSIRLRDKQNRDIQLQDLFSTAELENLLNYRERTKLLTERNKVLMSLLIYQGLTVGELEGAKISDIDLIEARIRIKATVNTNERELPLKPTQILLFQSYLERVRPKLLKEAKT